MDLDLVSEAEACLWCQVLAFGDVRGAEWWQI